MSHNLYDPNAERAVISAILNEPDVIPQVLNDLREEYFGEKEHKILLRTMLEIYERGEKIDPIILCDELEKTGYLGKIGGIPYINYLIDFTVNAYNIKSHIKIIKEKYNIRQIMLLCQDVLNKIDKGMKNSKISLIDYTIDRFLNLDIHSSAENIYNINDIITDYIDNLSVENQIMINTGYYELDRLIGNIIGGQYIILASRPSMGKTAFALNIARNIAKNNKSVAIFSAEQSRNELLLRFIAQNSNFTMEEVFSGQDIELNSGIENIYNLPIYIDDSPNITSLSIKSAVANLLKRKINISIVIIDYLQLLKTNTKYQSRYEEISAISREIKNISRELDIPFLVLAQLNRKLEDREDKRPKLSDLRDSGNIEQDADKVLFLYRDEVYNENTDFPHITEILVKKNRNGRLGSVQLYFNQEHISFYCLEKEE